MKHALLVVLLAACDPVYSVEGTVRDPSGAMLAGAKVEKRCPKGGTQTEATGSDGHFSFGGVGGSFEAGDCSLVIAAPGYATRTLHTYDVCYHNSQDRDHERPCTGSNGDVVLSRP